MNIVERKVTLLTIEQLAERWSCSDKKLAHQRVKGDGPEFVKLGNARNSPVRYPLECIEKFELERLRASTAR